jgi:hypothetical protein
MFLLHNWTCCPFCPLSTSSYDLMIPTSFWQCLQPESNPRPPTFQGLALSPSYPPLVKPQAPQAHMHTHVSKKLTYSSSIFDTFDWGSKIKILSWNFYGNVKIPYVLVVKISYFFQFKKINYMSFQKYHF